MDKFGLVPNPSFSVLFQFDLMHDCVIMKLKCLHMLNQFIFIIFSFFILKSKNKSISLILSNDQIIDNFINLELIIYKYKSKKWAKKTNKIMVRKNFKEAKFELRNWWKSYHKNLSFFNAKMTSPWVRSGLQLSLHHPIHQICLKWNFSSCVQTKKITKYQ